MIEDLRAAFASSAVGGQSPTPSQQQQQQQSGGENKLRLTSEKEILLAFRLLEESAREADTLARVEELFLPVHLAAISRKFLEISSSLWVNKWKCVRVLKYGIHVEW